MAGQLPRNEEKGQKTQARRISHQKCSAFSQRQQAQANKKATPSWPTTVKCTWGCINYGLRTKGQMLFSHL